MTTAERRRQLAIWRSRKAWNLARLKTARTAAARARYKARLAVIDQAIHDLVHPDVPVPATGLDVSENNGAIDFKAVKKAGHDFVYLKAGEGDRPDSRFISNVKAAKAAGLKVGAYHFLRPGNVPGRTGGQEAAHFIKRLQEAGLGAGDLLPAADIEVTKLSVVATVKYLQDFIAAVRFNTGHQVVVYTYPSFPTNWPTWVAAQPLWLADYDGKVDIPKPWKSIVMHQSSEKGTSAGVTGRVDLDHTSDLRKVIA